MDWLAEDCTEQKLTRKPWCVVIIDDDKEVHKATKLAMKAFEFQGRPIKFISAYSANEAKQVLSQRQDIAVILLDVVMETDDAGLQLVNYIRNELKNSISRIWLRTGQAGLAPKNEVIRNYDIDGYKAKTEVTLDSLHHLFYVALRSYRDICRIVNYKNGLAALINTLIKVDKLRDVQDYTTHLLQYLCEVLEAYEAELIVNHQEAVAINIKIRNCELVNEHISSHPEQTLTALINQALETKSVQYQGNFAAIYHKTGEDIESVVVLCVDSVLDDEAIDLIHVFIEHVSILISKF